MFLRWVGAGLGLFGLAMFLFGIYLLFLGDEAGRWPTTEGTIVETRIRTWSPTSHTSASRSRREQLREYYPEIEYQWTVDGKVYQGDRYKLGTTHRKYDERGDARTAAREFLAGEPITVYYDPNAPSQAVLDPSKDWFALLVPSVMGLVFLSCGFPLLRWGPSIQAKADRSQAEAHAETTSLS